MLSSFIKKISRSKRILVIHIAKTAGTSLRQMLEDEYGEQQIYPGIFYLKHMTNGFYPLGSEMLRDYIKLPPHKVLVGHFTAAMADMVPTPYETATFVRDPVQRSLSMLNFWSKIMHIPLSTLIDDTQFMMQHIADYQTRILGADHVCDPHQVGIADDDMLARAIKRLETINFIGITEHFSESCRKFDKQFNTQISKSVRYINIFRPAGNELAEYIQRVEPFLKHDYVLYETALAKFKAK
jgi:hypothetical protein